MGHPLAGEHRLHAGPMTPPLTLKGFFATNLLRVLLLMLGFVSLCGSASKPGCGNGLETTSPGDGAPGSPDPYVENFARGLGGS